MRGRPESSTRIWVEHCTVLDVAQLPRPFPKPAPEEERWLRLLGRGDALPKAAVTLTWPDGDQTYVQVDLATTRPNFGGVHYWYVCPRCGRRSLKLYAAEEGKQFGCQKCLRLVYGYCQYQKSGRWATLRRMRNWEMASPGYRRRWCKRLGRAWDSGKITDLEWWAILNFAMDLPRGC